MTNSTLGFSRDLVLVLGPHRSGSSVTTKLLESLGCSLGIELLGAELSNPIGHFENLKALNFNEDLLTRAGTDWKNPRPLIESDFIKINRTELEKAIDSLLTDLIENEKVTALKEPRISILLDLWKPALAKQIDNLKIVITVRHPSEVAASLNKRDGLNTILGLQLWGQAMLNGIRFARTLPSFFLYYEELIDNPIAVTTELSKFLDNSTKTSNHILPATNFVQSDFRHNKVSAESLSALKITTEIYDYVRKFRLATVQDFPDDLLDTWDARLNSTYLELNRNSLVLIDLQQRDELTQQRDELTQQRDELTQQRDELTQQRDELTQQRDELTQQRDERTQQRDELTQQRDELTQQRDELTQQRDELTQQRDNLISERDAAARALSAVVNSRIWRFTKLYRKFRSLKP